MKHLTVGVLLGGIVLLLGSNIGGLVYLIWANKKVEKETQIMQWLGKMRKIQALSIGSLISVCIITLIFSLILR